MTSSRPKKPASQQSVAAAILGNRPILSGELAADYDQLFESAIEAFAPINLVERLWVKDFVTISPAF